MSERPQVVGLVVALVGTHAEIAKAMGTPLSLLMNHLQPIPQSDDEVQRHPFVEAVYTLMQSPPPCVRWVGTRTQLSEQLGSALYPVNVVSTLLRQSDIIRALLIAGIAYRELPGHAMGKRIEFVKVPSICLTDTLEAQPFTYEETAE